MYLVYHFDDTSQIFKPVVTWLMTQVTGQTATEVKGTHETPVKHYIDDLTFAFQQDGSTCKVRVSVPLFNFAVVFARLDYSINFGDRRVTLLCHLT